VHPLLAGPSEGHAADDVISDSTGSPSAAGEGAPSSSERRLDGLFFRSLCFLGPRHNVEHVGGDEGCSGPAGDGSETATGESFLRTTESGLQLP